MKKYIIGLFSVFISSLCIAATTNTIITNTAYTAITGISGSRSAFTPALPAQCVFATSQPSASASGHSFQQNQTIPVNSLGSGIGLWCKSINTGNNFISVTTSTDAGVDNTGILRSTRINTATTTTLKTGAGVLSSAILGTVGVTSTLICYDNTSGSGTAITPSINTTVAPGVFNFGGVSFATGLTCVTTGGTPADLSISFK